MYRKIAGNLEDRIRKKGKLLFEVAGAVEGWSPTGNYKEHHISYVYDSGTKPDILSTFHLSHNHGQKLKYHVGGFKFIKNCGASLKNMWLRLIIEGLMKSAENASAEELVIITKDEAVVDVFLDMGFQVRKPNKDYSVYRGNKLL